MEQYLWLELLAMAKLGYIVHSLTQQTFCFTNHGLHSKFHIQGVCKVMNPTFEDRTMWLADVRVQLISNLEEIQRRYKENVDEHGKEQPSFKVGG